MDESARFLPQNVRLEVSVLLQRYLAALRVVSSEPILSLKPIVVYCGFALAWEFGLALLPIVFLINAVIWLVRRICRIQKPRYVPAWGWSLTIRAAKSLHRGEIPLLKFVVNRNLVRLFALLHLRNRIRQLADAMRLEFVTSTVQRQAHAALQANTDTVVLDTAASALSQRSELKLLLILLPAVELLSSAIGKLGLGLSFSKIASWFSFGGGEVRLSREQLQGVQHTILLVTIAIYLLMIVVSCFIRKREIFLAAGVYEAERDAATIAGIHPPREFSLDLIGWLLVVMIITIPSLVVQNRRDLTSAAIVMALYGTPFIYALIRRRIVSGAQQARDSSESASLGLPASETV